jgi:hypothetical protein
VLYGVSATFWSQGNIQEVYALNALLFLTAFYLALRLRDVPQSPKLMVALFFVCALGLSNHWPLFVLAGVALPLVLWSVRKSAWRVLCHPQTLAATVTAIALGLLPYAYLVWRAHHPVAYLGVPFAPNDWESFWQIVSRQVHFASDKHGGAGVADKIAFLQFVGHRVLWGEIGVLGGILAVIGFLRQWRLLSLSLATALTVMFLTGTVILIWRLDVLYDALQEQIFSVYPLLPYAVVCVWSALAFAGRRYYQFAPVICAVLALGLNFSANDRRQHTLAEDGIRAFFDVLPAGGWIPYPSQFKFAKYLQITENIRPDVAVLPAPNPYVFEVYYAGPRLYAPNTLAYENEVRAVNVYARHNALCYNVFVLFDASWQSDEHLLFSCLSEKRRVVNHPAVVVWLRRLINSDYPLNDQRAREFTGKAIEDATRTMLQLRARLQLPEQWRELLSETRQTPHGLLAEVEFLRDKTDLLISRRRVDEMATLAASGMLSRRNQARLLSALGDLYAAVSPRNEDLLSTAIKHHAAAAALLPDAQSAVVQRALSFYREEKLFAEEQQLIARYGTALFEHVQN